VISSTQRPLPDKTQHSQETDILAPAGFEPEVPGSERPQTHALDRAATAIFNYLEIISKNYVSKVLHHAVAQLRHCATNRNVAGSIPDGVTGIFH
jgi:hypothetical protein